jgi:hypothetical protein
MRVFENKELGNVLGSKNDGKMSEKFTKCLMKNVVVQSRPPSNGRRAA